MVTRVIACYRASVHDAINVVHLHSLHLSFHARLRDSSAFLSRSDEMQPRWDCIAEMDDDKIQAYAWKACVLSYLCGKPTVSIQQSKLIIC